MICQPRAKEEIDTFTQQTVQEVYAFPTYLKFLKELAFDFLLLHMCTLVYFIDSSCV